jgi:hypothetical protein
MTSILKVDTIQDQSGNNIINENADTITIGASGDTISIPAGATLANSGTVTGIPASAIDSGTIATARLGSGTASSSTFLRGDQTYAAAGLSGWSEDGANNNLLPASASAGIYLGVSSATAANLLDDYEEGTFTPTIALGITSVGYSSRWGQYTKIGNTVSFSFNIQTNAGTLNSSRLKFGGLPFDVSGSGRGFAVFNFVDGDFINSKTNNLPTLVFEPNPTIEAYFTDGTQFLGTDLTNASGNNIYIAGVYESV